jgi:hypothetical protein
MSEYGSESWQRPAPEQPQPYVPEQRAAEPSDPVGGDAPATGAPAGWPQPPSSPPAPAPAPVTSVPSYSPGYPPAPQPGWPQPQPQWPQPAWSPSAWPQQSWPQPQWPQPSWPPPSPVPDRRRFGVGALVAVAVITAVLCGVGGIVAGVAIKTASTGTSGSPATSTGARSAAPEDVGQALLSRIVPPPDGAKTFTLPAGTDGVFTLDQDVTEFFSTEPTMSGVLSQEGFVVAAAMDYRRTDGYEILTHLTQFATASGAQSYLLGRKSSWTHDLAITGEFTVPGGGLGYEKNGLDTLGNRRTAMFECVGDIVITVDVYTPGTLNRTVDLAAMAAQVAAMK